MVRATAARQTTASRAISRVMRSPDCESENRWSERIVIVAFEKISAEYAGKKGWSSRDE
jgi:hypothetical protein